MIYGMGLILFVTIVLGPSLWVKYVMWRHSKELPGMPGSGGDLAKHLVNRFQLEGVTVVSGAKNANYYDPLNKVVSLSSEIYKGKSLTAVAVAAHEVGHAIQFSRQEPVSQLRQKYLGSAIAIKKLGALILIVAPIIFAMFKIPHIFMFSVLIGITTLIASALVYVAVLPEEYDASFKKALPILEADYLPKEYMPEVNQVLKAAALTYLAGALADAVRLWQLLRYIR